MHRNTPPERSGSRSQLNNHPTYDAETGLRSFVLMTVGTLDDIVWCVVPSESLQAWRCQTRMSFSQCVNSIQKYTIFIFIFKIHLCPPRGTEPHVGLIWKVHFILLE